MNPLYIFYLIDRDVFDPEMEGLNTDTGYPQAPVLLLGMQSIIQVLLFPCQNTPKLHSMRKR